DFVNKKVSEEEVKTCILNYSKQKMQEGSRQLAVTLEQAEIKFSDNLITLTIHNETQREQLANVKQIFLDDVRKQLQNNSVGLDIQISQVETQAKPFKPSDIFKAMSEKNPALLEMKKRFDLDIEY